VIPVTKPYLPDRKSLDDYLDGIYERQWLTNNGQLVQMLTERLETYLGVENLLLVGNGTLALQIAYRALGVSERSAHEVIESITTPFTFVATASSLKWEGVDPVFTDIDRNSWCLDADGIEAAISKRTRAITPVHVFGNACEVERIEEIADRNGLKVVYDAAHAFGVNYKGKSLLRWGDAATLSFHATKVFHTIEGGAIIFRRKEDLVRAKNMINFGITGPEKIEGLGINAKMNEVQAAMGLCVLDEMEKNDGDRKAVWDSYQECLNPQIQRQQRKPFITNNYGYYPVALRHEDMALTVLSELRQEGVGARRYFYPSLDTLPEFGVQGSMDKSRDIASRIICLPIFSGLDRNSVELISAIVNRNYG